MSCPTCENTERNNRYISMIHDCDDPWHDELAEETAWLEDDTPLACGIENPETCESCQ